jgi:hypothetical protein
MHVQNLPPFFYLIGKIVGGLIALMLLVLGFLKIRNRRLYGPGPK